MGIGAAGGSRCTQSGSAGLKHIITNYSSISDMQPVYSILTQLTAGVSKKHGHLGRTAASDSSAYWSCSCRRAAEVAAPQQVKIGSPGSAQDPDRLAATTKFGAHGLKAELASAI